MVVQKLTSLKKVVEYLIIFYKSACWESILEIGKWNSAVVDAEIVINMEF